jgi:hypothetical protein
MCVGFKRYSPYWDSEVSEESKMAVFWVVVPCSLVDVYRRFGGTWCLHHQRDRPDDGGSKYVWNVGKRLSDYTMLQPRRQPFSYSPPWEPQSYFWRILPAFRNFFRYLVGGMYLHRTVQQRKTWRHINASSGIPTHDPSVWVAAVSGM